MTNAENNERGVLTVSLQYIGTVQTINSAIYHHQAAIKMLNSLKDKLDIAAIKKGLAEKERRINLERRSNERRN